MTHRTIYVSTPTAEIPSYLILTHDDAKDAVTVAVSEKAHTGEGYDIVLAHAAFTIPSKNELANLFLCIGEHLYGDEAMLIAGHAVLTALTRGPQTDTNDNKATG